MLHLHGTHRYPCAGVVVGPMIPGRCAVQCCSRHNQASLTCLRNLRPHPPQAAKAEMRQVATRAASGVCGRVFASLRRSKGFFPGVALFSCVWSPSYFVVPFVIRSGHDLRGNRNLCCAAAELHLEAPLEIRPADIMKWRLGPAQLQQQRRGFLVPLAARTVLRTSAAATPVRLACGPGGRSSDGPL